MTGLRLFLLSSLLILTVTQCEAGFWGLLGVGARAAGTAARTVGDDLVRVGGAAGRAVGSVGDDAARHGMSAASKLTDDLAGAAGQTAKSLDDFTGAAGQTINALADDGTRAIALAGFRGSPQTSTSVKEWLRQLARGSTQVTDDVLPLLDDVGEITLDPAMQKIIGSAMTRVARGGSEVGDATFWRQVVSHIRSGRALRVADEVGAEAIHYATQLEPRELIHLQSYLENSLGKLTQASSQLRQAGGGVGSAADFYIRHTAADVVRALRKGVSVDSIKKMKMLKGKTGPLDRFGGDNGLLSYKELKEAKTTLQEAGKQLDDAVDTIARNPNIPLEEMTVAARDFSHTAQQVDTITSHIGHHQAANIVRYKELLAAHRASQKKTAGMLVAGGTLVAGLGGGIGGGTAGSNGAETAEKDEDDGRQKKKKKQTGKEQVAAAENDYDYSTEEGNRNLDYGFVARLTEDDELDRDYGFTSPRWSMQDAEEEARRWDLLLQEMNMTVSDGGEQQQQQEEPYSESTMKDLEEYVQRWILQEAEQEKARLADEQQQQQDQPHTDNAEVEKGQQGEPEKVALFQIAGCHTCIAASHCRYRRLGFPRPHHSSSCSTQRRRRTRSTRS